MRPEQVITVNYAPLVLYSFGEQKLAWSECCVGRLTVKNVVFQRKVKSSVTEITFKSHCFCWKVIQFCSLRCLQYHCCVGLVPKQLVLCRDEVRKLSLHDKIIRLLRNGECQETFLGCHMYVKSCVCMNVVIIVNECSGSKVKE